MLLISNKSQNLLLNTNTNKILFYSVGIQQIVYYQSITTGVLNGAIPLCYPIQISNKILLYSVGTQQIVY
jgi:hypothetical protein